MPPSITRVAQGSAPARENASALVVTTVTGLAMRRASRAEQVDPEST